MRLMSKLFRFAVAGVALVILAPVLTFMALGIFAEEVLK